MRFTRKKHPLPDPYSGTSVFAERVLGYTDWHCLLLVCPTFPKMRSGQESKPTTMETRSALRLQCSSGSAGHRFIKRKWIKIQWIINSHDWLWTNRCSRWPTDHRSSIGHIQPFCVTWRRPHVGSCPRRTFIFFLAAVFHTHFIILQLSGVWPISVLDLDHQFLILFGSS